jgi:hypothetical protein
MKTPTTNFQPFSKIPRLSRECTVTEKLDGTSATIFIDDSGEIFCGSRNRWITPADDNYGFARWAEGNRDELLKLGPGWTRGEWWGQGIQRNYGEKSKHFSLFNTARWTEQNSPLCCRVVPVLYQGEFNTNIVEGLVLQLRANGSVAAPGFLDPEGVVVFHSASGQLFKKTVRNDESPKSLPDLKNPKQLAAGVDAAQAAFQSKRPFAGCV